MKKLFVVMLMVFVAVNVNGQLIVDFRDAGRTAVLPGGAQMDITGYPGWTHFRSGYTIQENVLKFLNELRNSPEEYVRQVRLAAAQGITVPAGGVMMTGGAVVGGGIYGGMQVTDSNLLTTYGSGVYASFDGKHPVFWGDPLMAVGRTLDYFGGKLTSKKKKAARAAAAAQQTRSAQQQNVVVVYIDSATGQVIRTQQQAATPATQTRSAQQAQQTRSAQPATQQATPYQTSNTTYYSGF